MMIRPYGDTMNDGAIQMSFTLPVAHSAKADEAAIVYTKKLGFKEVELFIQIRFLMNLPFL